MLCEFWSGPSENHWTAKGLVLRYCAEGEIFSRIGVFEYNTAIAATSGGRTEEEDSVQWSERVDRQHNWFKYCVPRIIAIL
jgi:hypothetical protein